MEQSGAADVQSTHYVDSDSVKYVVQPVRVREHFAALWHLVGVEVQPGSGDRFYSCPFHREQNPSMHIDAQLCIWNCLSPACPGHRGGGIRQLEGMVGPLDIGPLPAGLAFHIPPHSDSPGASELGSSPYPNADDADVDKVLEELKARSKEMFPLPEGEQPKVISRLCAFTEDPSRLIRHQVISNTWIHPVNRALKRRQAWVHLMHLFAAEGVDLVWGISISPEEWNDNRREALAAQVNRRCGQYAAFDNRTEAGKVRFLTSVPIPGAAPVDDINTALFKALRDLDLPEGDQQQRVHLVWLSQGWSMPAHESKGTVKTIAYKRDVNPVDDAKEEAQARQIGLETWQGAELGDPEQWGAPRYFAVPQQRVTEIGPGRAFNDLLMLAEKLGYRPVRDIRHCLFPSDDDEDVGG